MKKKCFIIAAAVLFAQGVVWAQTEDRSSSTPASRPPASSPPPQQQPSRPAGFDLAEFGVQIEPEPRLIVMMAALDAAGFDPTPRGSSPSLFRGMVRKDQASLDPALLKRLQDFYRRNKLPESATPAEQAARYVSLAYALGAPPTFDAPVRTDDLPAGLLEVLDFAPLVREFYLKSGMDERLPAYIRAYRAEGDRLRLPTAEMVRSTLSYLHTRPVTTIIERVPVRDPAQRDKKKDAAQKFVTREKMRRFLVVPDLLGAPGAINFRVIGDDYYAVVPQNTDPASSELRRAYLQYLIDPLVARFNREIAARRADIRALLDAQREKTGKDVTTDVFLAVARSLVTAADARMSEAARLGSLARKTSTRLKSAPDDAGRAAIVKESQAERARIEDASVAQLAEAYERGAVLSFYFTDQLRGLEASGFDIANFFSDMIASFDVAREGRRPAEYAAARERHAAARRESQLARANTSGEAAVEPEDPRRASLVKSLREVEELLRLKNYVEAETRLRALQQEFQDEPRILFALGQAASLSAQDAFDEKLQAERLNRALSLYQFAAMAASAETDRALRARAHVARGRILAFLERNEEAIKEFDTAIGITEANDAVHADAVAERKKLLPPE